VKSPLIRWLRLTLPPMGFVVAAVFVLLCAEGFYLWVRCWLESLGPTAEAPSELLKMRNSIAGVAAAAYGVFRAVVYHPFFRSRYRDWLEQTPWTSRQPLPAGPIHLMWQDAVVMGIFLLSLHGFPLGRIWVLQAFLFAYLGTLGVSFWGTGPWWMGYGILFGLGLVVRLLMWPFVALDVLAIVYVAAFVGLRTALARFPWPDSRIPETLRQQFTGNIMARRKWLLGWPYRQMSGVPQEHAVRPRDGILAPLLAAWWVWALASHSSDPTAPVPVLSFIYATFVSLFARLLVYVGSCRPPISLWGRIATGRLIIPGYDYVFVAPLCTLLVAAIGVTLAFMARMKYSTITFPLAMAAVLIVALNMGPSFRSWHLTGHHRIAAWGSKDPNHVKL
jgi:hypothetical protein